MGLYLGARSTGGTLGTRSARVTLLPGLSLLAFGTGLSIGALMGTAATMSGVRMWGEDVGVRWGLRGETLTGGPANPAGPGAPGSPRSP